MCFAVLLSRAWLALQYLVTTIMCTTRKHRSHRLTLPLAANSLLFLCVAAVFGGLLAGFRNVRKELTGVLIGVYVVLTIEFFGTLTISMFWRKLSFKATHVGERLGLLGLIIIGEGVIGLSKTIVRTMGKNGPTIGSSAQVFCIILILVFMWYALTVVAQSKTLLTLLKDLVFRQSP
jgi:low temperature requirement protein LtrA